MKSANKRVRIQFCPARLYDGFDENGQSLVTNASGKSDQRIPAFDLTFSAPRSVSLAWTFADEDLRRNLETAQARAVRSALATIEKEAIFARRGKDGMRVERVSLTAAMFQHGESRSAEHADGRIFSDPNLCTHAVVLNLATRADGAVGALHSTVLRDWKMAASAVYHVALAKEMIDLRFDIDRVGKNGTFELTGISDKAITYFSARRHEIEKELTEAGTTSGSSRLRTSHGRFALNSSARASFGAPSSIEAVTPSGQATRVEIAPGDKIRFQLRNDRLGVVNGTVATVTAVHTDPSREPDSRELDYGR